MKKLIIVSAATLLLITNGCTKYLDVLPKGVIIPGKTSDYEGVLNSVDLESGTMTPQHLATDDLFNAVALVPNNSNSNIYYWRGRVDELPTDIPQIWAKRYDDIRALNLVTSEVLNSTGGTEQQKKQFYAEAQVIKAYEYYHLMVAFSPAYDPATAKSVYGVPLVTSVDPGTPLPARPDLQSFTDELIKMVKNAVPDLPATNINLTRITKNMAYGMLSRIYLYLGDYTNSLNYANLVLADPAAILLNYNNYASLTTFPRTNVNPEELMYRYSVASAFQYSTDLLGKFDVAKDLRIILFSKVASNIRTYSPGSSSIIPNYGISYAEIYLNKAECLARSGDITNALDIVNNTIRKNRFSPSNYTPLTATTTDQAINAVLDERRRELAFKGIRWSDMKRFDKEGRMPVITRLSSTGALLATLNPHDKNYTFQIPLMVQSFNPTMPLN